jgi:glycine cleavage system H protein
MVALFVAAMFVSLVLVDLAVEKWRVWHAARLARATSRAAAANAYGLDWLCLVPEGVHLAKQHTWLKSDPAGGLEVGADGLIARAVGAACRVVLPRVGDQVTAGQPLFCLEHHGRALTVRSAITGRVMAVNQRLVEHPELLSSDPYGKGWVCYLHPTGMDEAAAPARFGEQASMWLESEFTRLREFVFGQVTPDLALGVTSQDGGLPAAGCLVELDPAAWTAFESAFLQ